MVEQHLDIVLRQLERLVSATRAARRRDADGGSKLYRLRSDVEHIREEIDSRLEQQVEARGRQAMKLLRPWKEAHGRLAWKPIVQARDGSLTASKFCGIPWLANDEEWPKCGYCRTPLQLLLQLNLAQLPKELADQLGPGLLQCFYCVHGEDESGDDCPSMTTAWKPFSKGKLVRLVHARGSRKTRPVPIERGYFPGKTVVEWRRFTDFPSPVEFGELGLKFTKNSRTSAMEVKCGEPKLNLWGIPHKVQSGLCEPRGGDKLAGWPKWIQGVEYPKCPRCRTRMRFIFQIDSRDHVPYNFGDMGCGHITQCPKHKQILTFSWACY